jgi:MFS transporter, DHA3 family, macrolide efflux protein
MSEHKLWNRNFALLWAGQSVSRLGAQGFLIAMLFWVKHATGSETLVGLLMMVSALPTVLLGPLGGSFADRHSRKTIIVLSDLARGALVLALAGMLFFFPNLVDWEIGALFVVSILSGVVLGIFNPAVVAATPDLVAEDRVMAANSLGQVSIQLASFIGTGLGGVLFDLLGAPVLFLVNGLTYLFAAGCETVITIPQKIPAALPGLRQEMARFWEDTRAGVGYVWRQTGLRDLVFISAFTNFFFVPILVLLPFFVEDVLKVGPEWYGFLAAGNGIGALLGYAFAASVHLPARTTGRMMMAFLILESLGDGALGLVRSPQAALGMAVLGGALSGFVLIMVTTLVQVRTPKDLRGRVFGVSSTLAGAISPLAMGLSGVVADLLGHNISLVYVGCGVCMTLLSILVVLDRPFRDFLMAETPVTAEENVLLVEEKAV